MMFCRFWCIYKILFFLGLSDWKLHLYNLLHNPELHCVIVDFSAELFPAFQGQQLKFSPDLWNKQNNDTTVHSFPRLGIHARVIFALLARFVAPIPHHQTIFKGGLSKQKPPKTFIWALPPACESQSSVRSCFFTAGAFIDAWLHHLEKLPTSLSAHHVAPQHPGDHYPANTGRTHLFGFSIKPILWNEAW